MSEHIKVEYAGVEIVYDEGSNLFVFTLRGRERTVESLRAAKAAIDAPAPKEKNPFQRTKAWKKDYRNGWQEWEVTSIAGTGYGGKIEFWDTLNKDRRKLSEYDLRAFTPANAEIVKEVDGYLAEIAALRDRIEKAEEKMVKFTIPKDVE